MFRRSTIISTPVLALFLLITVVTLSLSPLYASIKSNSKLASQQASTKVITFVDTYPWSLFAPNPPYVWSWEDAISPFVINNDPFGLNFFTKSFSIQKGETLLNIFLRAYLSIKEAYWAIHVIKPLIGSHSLKLGQKVEMIFMPDAEFTPLAKFKGIKIYLDAKNFLLLERGSDGTFTASKKQKPTVRRLIRAEGAIQDSLYQTFKDNNVPSKVFATFLDLYSFEVDFQRDLKSGDQFALLYEGFFDENNELVDCGKIFFLSLQLEEKNSAYYLFKDAKGNEDYFGATGEGIKKSLLKTPTLATRISSKFGNRLHPVFGHSKFHKGIDFSTPRGTPIWAAGDGVITFMGWHGGYGRFVKIRHNGDYSTAYAHLSRFKAGLSVGGRVSQKQVIGYVGATGVTTGPHLHYEVIKNGESINPISIKLPADRKLNGSELSAFIDQKQDIIEMMSNSEEYTGSITKEEEENAAEEENEEELNSSSSNS
ncbi:MAG: M23 family metallopeptidase [Oligoflexia bacterium]|nr:M23 family metallopeptidase [Oligoflexia bacterium]MBF0365809.1 M23 family metallopeptidase [Oligoflexia bacterium]